MNHKTATLFCSIACTVGVLCLTCLMIIWEFNALFILFGGLGLLFIALGLVVKYLFFRCPHCGQRLPMKSDGSYCPHCKTKF